MLPTPDAYSGSRGGSQHPDKKRVGGHQVVLSDVVEHELLPSAVALLPTPNTMEHLPVREGEAYEKHLHRGDLNGSRRNAGSNLREVVVHDLLPTPAAADGSGSGRHNSTGHQDTLPGTVLLMTPKAGDADFGLPRTSGRPPEKSTHLATQLEFNQFGLFKAAIDRWQTVIGRPAPAPTRPTGMNGGQRLSPEFTEWMMGVPAGHITNPEIWAGGGLTDSQIRNAQLKACGNGVVPQQAALAVERLLQFVPSRIFRKGSQ